MVDVHSSTDPTSNRSVDRNCLATVRLYFEERGYGFFSAENYPDIFFHLKELCQAGKSSAMKGDLYRIDITKVDKGGKTSYRAYNLRQTFSPPESQRQGFGNSGSFHAQNIRSVRRYAIPRTEVTSHNGEIVSQRIAPIEKHPIAVKVLHKGSRVNIGLPVAVTVPKPGPIIVSATGRGSAELAPKCQPTPEEVKIQEEINKKKRLLRSLNLPSLPDGGRRLNDDIVMLELKLKSLSVKSAQHIAEDKTELSHRKKDMQYTRALLHDNESLPNEVQRVFSAPDSLSFGSLAEKSRSTNERKAILVEAKPAPLDVKTRQCTLDSYDMGPMKKSDAPLYGGRMTSLRLTEVRQVIKDSIESLHKSLETCPAPTDELDDPEGLLVELMSHQKQALAWLVWREKQSVSGGILADDMGLGKTLTMISLILKQMGNSSYKTATDSEDDRIEDFDGSSDSDVVLVQDSPNKENKKHSGAKSASETDDGKKKQGSSLIKSNGTLIVAPASLLFHWKKEIMNRCKKALLSIHLFHGPDRARDPTRLAEFDVIITTYDIVRRSSTAAKSGETVNNGTIMQIEWRRLILDEAHHIKNYKSLVSEATCNIPARTRWAMSGTPVQNNLTDMYAMLKFLHCKPFDEYKVWKNQVDNKSTKGKQRLQTLVSCLVLRREKSQSDVKGKPLVNLPERKLVTHKLKLNVIEREVYNKLQTDSQAAFKNIQEKKKKTAERKEAKAMGVTINSAVDISASSSSENTSTSTLLVMLLRLRQCCGHLSLLKESFDPELLQNEKKELALEDVFQSLDISNSSGKSEEVSMDKYQEKDKSQYFEKSYLSGKIEFLLDELNILRFEKPEDKCVVISQWTSMLEVVAYHLDKVKISYAMIKGSVSAKKRMDMVDEFNRNPAVPMIMLLSLQAGGVGLNLIGGNHLYLLDMHWNPALECQAFDRIYRVGQTKPVFIHKFVVENTVEERIVTLQERKLTIAKSVMDGSGSEDKKKLTLQDMKLLFGI